MKTYTQTQLAKQKLLLAPNTGKPTNNVNTVRSILKTMKAKRNPETFVYSITEDQIESWNQAVRFVKGV